MNTFVKSYQLLSDSADCDLHLLLSNISGPDHVAAKAYDYLFEILSSHDMIRINLRSVSTWNNVLGLAAVAKLLNKQIEIHIDAAQQLTIKSFFCIWAACQLGAKVQRAPFTDNFLREITAEQERLALEKAVSELLKSIPQDCKHLVIPYETTCFKRCDFTVEVQKEYKGDLQIMSVPEENDEDFYCWIQTINNECTYEKFYWDISQGKGFSQATLKNAFEFLPEKLVPELAFEHFDEMEQKLFDEMNTRFQEEPELFHTSEVTQAELLEAFRQFFNESHTIATGGFLAGLAGVLSKKFVFEKSEKIYCWVTGSVQTQLHEQDFLSSMHAQIVSALEKACEIVDISVEYNLDSNELTKHVLEVLDKHAFCIQNMRFEEQRLFVSAQSPGYQALVVAVSELKSAFGKKNVECKQMPRRAPPMKAVKAYDYSEEVGKAEPFVSELKSVFDITPESVKAADQRLVDNQCIDKTGILSSNTYNAIIGRRVYFVMENLQQTGSFKIRGATNMLLKAKEQNPELQGIVGCSAGNHAQGCAKTAHKLGVKCTIVCPESAPATKLLATQRYGAEVIKYGEVFDAANEYAIKLAEQRHWLLVPPYNSCDVIEGQATIAYEMYEKIQPDTVLVNIGGGGMIAGITQYLKSVNPKIQIIGCQAEKVFPFEGYETSHQLKQVDKTAVTIADGCNVKFPGGVHNPIFEKISKFVGVSENQIASTVVNFLLTTKTVTEGAGIMGLAALLYKKYIPAENEKIAIIVCGGNIDLSRMNLIFKTGMISLGRYLQMKLLLPNHNGGLLKFMKICQKYGGICDKVRSTTNETKCTWDSCWMTISVRMPCLEACEALKKELDTEFGNILYENEDVIVK